MAKNGLKQQARALAARLAPHMGLFGHDTFADIAKRCGGFDPQVIFDVGANIGTTARAFRKRFPQAAIHAFEPSDVNYQALLANTRAAGVTCVQAGLGAQPRTAAFFHDAQNPTMARILEAGEGTQSIEILRLDDYCADHAIPAISYLKIDTEGHDLEVLLGAQRMLASRSIAFIEVESGIAPDNAYHVPLRRFLDLLEPAGYGVFGFYEQVAEWTRSRPYLRRSNVVFMPMVPHDKAE